MKSKGTVSRSLRLLGGDSPVRILHVISWYKKYQFLYRSFKVADVLDSAFLVIQRSVSHCYLCLLHVTIRVTISFFYAGDLPQVPRKIVVADDYNISLLKVTSRTYPLLSQLKSMKEPFFPTYPKLVSQVLDSSPSLSKI